MKLVIRDTNNIYDDNFIMYVLKFIQNYISLEINKKQNIKIMESWTEYLQEYSVYSRFKNKTYLDCRYIITSGINNLVVKKNKNVYTITIDNTKTIKGIGAKLYVLCKLIDTGCLDRRKFPVFTNTFNYVRNNLGAIRTLYMMGVKI